MSKKIGRNEPCPCGSGRKYKRCHGAKRKPSGKAYQELVAQVMKAFDPGATVEEGEWIDGPDGRLDMDVSIRGTVDGRPILAVVECKDFNLATTGKVDRPIVDALDSKRHDLGADVAIICSNSGFTRDALSKARRKNIGAISVLAEGDERVKIVVERETYHRKISLVPVEIKLHGDLSRFAGVQPTELLYKGLPVVAWLQMKAWTFARAHPEISARLRATFRLKQPHELDLRGQRVALDALEIAFTPQTRWFSQVVQVDAKLGIYDYLRGRVRLAGGENSYTIRGIDFDKAEPLDAAPVIDGTRRPGEIDVDLAIVELAIPHDEESPPPLEEIVVPEDIEMKLG